MYLNPFPFGIVIGVVSTIVVEIVVLIALAIERSDKK